MLNKLLADFYERDIRKLKEEVTMFKDEANLWRIQGSVRNPAGNLVLHIVGGTHYLIGATLAKTGYVRNRDLEFTQRDIDRNILVAGLDELIPLVRQTLEPMTPEDMESEYPFMFDGAMNSKAYVLTQLLVHLNYHLGQVNYIRRMLE